MTRADTEIAKAIEEFTPLYDEVTTDELQGIVLARSMQIAGNYRLSGLTDEIEDISNKILEGIYDAQEVTP